MLLRIGSLLFVLALVASDGMLAPRTVRSEPLKSAPGAPPLDLQQAPAADDKPSGRLIPLAPSASVPEIITNLSRLPAPGARAPARIFAAAPGGELGKPAPLVKQAMPRFSFTAE